MIDNWRDISDAQIEEAVLKIIEDYAGAQRRSLASNLLSFYISREFPFPGDSKEERLANLNYIERFRMARVEPIVESLVSSGKIVVDVDFDNILYIRVQHKITY